MSAELELEVENLHALYSSLPKDRMEHVILKEETELVEKGALNICGKNVRGVKIFPGRHDVFYRNDDQAHPDECHDFGVSNYIIMRVLRGDPYPLDVYVCRREGCEKIMVQDPLSSDEVGGVFRKPPHRKP